MQHLDVNELAHLSVTFYDQNGDAADPTGVTLTIVAPDGTTTQPAATQDGTGEYSYDLTVDQAGAWQYTFEGVGAVVATESDVLLVGLSDSAPGPFEAWCTWDDVTHQTTVDLSSVSARKREEIVDFATAILFGETGSRYPGFRRSTFGLCDCCCGSLALVPPFVNWSDAGWAYAGWRGRCAMPGCTGRSDHVDLTMKTGLPVAAALSVTVAGDAVDHSSWRIDGRRWLVRTDGETWPHCPDLTDPSEFEGVLVYGRGPYQGGDIAAAALAAEMGKFEIQATCNIPEGVTDIMRAGITYRVRDAKDLLDDGLSGVPSTDRWLVAERNARKSGPGAWDAARDDVPVRLGTDRGLDR